MPCRLTYDLKLASPPVDIAKLQRCDLTGTKTQPDQQQHDRTVPPAGHRRNITGCKQRPNLSRFQRVRERLLRPRPDLWNQILQRIVHQPVDIQKGEQRPQCSRDTACRRRPLLTLSDDIRADVTGVQPAQHDPSVIVIATDDMLSYERSYQINVQPHRAGSKTTLYTQIPCKTCEQNLDRSVWCHNLMWRQDPTSVQEVDQRNQRTHRSFIDIPGGTTHREILLDPLKCQPRHFKVLIGHPAA